jgi:hypothetical protein
MVHRFCVLAAAGLLGSRRNARSAASSLASERREREAALLFLDQHDRATAEAAARAAASEPA